MDSAPYACVTKCRTICRGWKTAYATIMGFEVMRALRKDQAAILSLTQDICEVFGERFNIQPAWLLWQGNDSEAPGRA